MPILDELRKTVQDDIVDGVIETIIDTDDLFKVFASTLIYTLKPSISNKIKKEVDIFSNKLNSNTSLLKTTALHKNIKYVHHRTGNFCSFILYCLCRDYRFILPKGQKAAQKEL